MKRDRNSFRSALLAAALAALAPQWAMASTPPCTQINNMATVAFKVGGIDQTDANSNTSSFNVGAKIMIDVLTQDSSNISISPGGSMGVLTYRVINNSNAPLDFNLASAAAASTTPSPHGGGNDSFDLSSVSVFAETNGTAGYQAGGDTATSIDNLAADGGTTDVYIVYSPTDLTAANGALAVYYLTASSLWADGSAITPGNFSITSAQAGAACGGGTTIDIVISDQDGPGTYDGANDGADTDDSAFIVSSANISVSKNYTVVSDPINGTTSPKAIPGAVIRYSIAISNTGGGSAVLSTISDTLAATLQVVDTANNATWAVSGGSTRSTNSGTLTADTNGADGLAHTDPTAVAGTLTATLTTILTVDAPNSYAAGELKAGETFTLTFDATLQ